MLRDGRTELTTYQFGKMPAIGQLVGDSLRMRQLRHTIHRVGSGSDSAVLIVGESGCGKELVAESIHQISRRCTAPFIAMNCATIPATLIEAELFGFDRGSFTGANRSHAGIFERAAGGTVFLDEITEMSLDMQACLLRVLETKRFTRSGGSSNIVADVRVIAAANRCPQQAIRDGKLRADVYYRLAVLPINVPPLRDRGHADIDLLIDHFLKLLNEECGSNKIASEGMRQQFHRHRWPGNVRELRNSVERAFIMSDEVLEPLSVLGPAVPETATMTAVSPPAGQSSSIEISVGTNLLQAEQLLIELTLKCCAGNRQRAAKLLGCSLKTLYNKLQSYRLTIEPIDVMPSSMN